MSLLTRPVDELVRYILKRLHGGLILNDLDINNFSSHLSGGRFKLSNIELNPEAVNAFLSDSPIHLLSAKLGKITVQMPSVTRLLEEAIVVEAEGIEVELCSAANSGFEVRMRREGDEQEEEGEDESAMIFGRAIEQIITNMRVSLIQTKVRLKASPASLHSIDLYLPEISLKDTSSLGSLYKTKELKVKGFIVSVPVGPPAQVLNPLDYAHICQMTEETSVSISASKEVTQVEVRVKRLMSILAPEQAKILWEIAKAMEKSKNIRDEQGGEISELLHRTYLSLDEDVRLRLQQATKKPKSLTFKLSLSSLDLILLTEEPHFCPNRTWDLHPCCDPYAFLSASHIVISANTIFVEKNPNRGMVRIQMIEAFHHELVEMVGIGGSSLFMSARESFTPEFFRQNSVRDELWHFDPETHHYCTAPLLYFDPQKEPIHTYLPEYDLRPSKRAVKLAFTPQSLAIKIAPIYMNVKEPLIRSLEGYIAQFPTIAPIADPPPPPPPLPPGSFPSVNPRAFTESNNPTVRQRPSMAVLLSTKVIDVNYTTNSDVEETPGLTLSTITNSLSLFIISENDIEKVVGVENVEVEISRQGQGSEAYYCVTLTEEKNRLGRKKEMYIPGQGTMVVPEYFRASEPYDEQYEKMCPQAEELPIDPDEERKAFESATVRVRLAIHSINVNLDPTCVQQLVELMKCGENQQKERGRRGEGGKIAVLLSVDTLKFNIMERRLPPTSQVRVSHLPFSTMQRSTVVSTLDASAIRSRTICATAKSGKMVDRRLAVAEFAFSTLNLVTFQDYLKPGQTFIRMGISRIRASYLRMGEESKDSDVFAYSLHPEALPKMQNSEAITMMCTVNSYAGAINFVTRVDPSQPLMRSKTETQTQGESKEINVNVMVRAVILRMEQILGVIDKLGQFRKINWGKSQSLDLMKVKVQAKSVIMDYVTEKSRMVLEIDDFSFWTALVTNLDSKGMHAAISSSQLYLLDCTKDDRSELSFPLFDPPSRLCDFLQDYLGFTLVLSLDSMEVFFSQVVNPQKTSEGESVPEESPPLLSCLLGGSSCKPVSDSLFMCDLAEHPLKHDILDVHLNLGCLMVFLCADSLDCLSKCFQNLNKDINTLISHLSDDSTDPFDSTLAAAGVTVHNCASKGSKVNLMNLAESQAWERAQPGSGKEEEESDSGIDDFEDFEEEKAKEDPKEVQGEMETFLFRLPHVIHSHISFPSIVKLETIDSDFHQLKPVHGFPIMRITASLSHISVTLYQGLDFDFHPRREGEVRPGEGFVCREKVLRRRVRKEKKVLSCSLKLRQESTGVTFTKFPRKLHYAWRLSFTIRDFEVLDQIQLSDVYKLLHLNREFPRGPGTHMLAVDLASVWPRPELNDEEELRIMVSLLPLKINLDQYAVNFVVDLLEHDKPSPASRAMSAQVRPPAITSAQNPITRSTHALKPSVPDKSADGFVQSLKIASISLTLDYIPRNYLFEGVKATSAANAINLFPIENLVLTLPEAHITGQKNVKEAIVVVCNLWENHIRSNEILSILGGIGPLVSVKNVGAALLNLVKSPYSSPNPLNTAKKGLVTLATVLSVESLGLLGAALTTLHTAVGSIGRIAGIESTLITRQQVLRPILKAKYTVIPT